MINEQKPSGEYRHVLLKASLKRRIQLAWRLLNNKPTLYRVGISDGRIFLPEQLRPESAYICRNIIDMLDDNGDAVRVPGIGIKGALNLDTIDL